MSDSEERRPSADDPRSGRSGRPSSRSKRRVRADQAGRGGDDTTGRRRKVVRRRRGPEKSDEEPRSNLRAWLFGAALLVGLAVAAAASYVLVVYPQRAKAGEGLAVEITVAPNTPLATVAADLARAGVIVSPRTFEIYARLVGVEAIPGLHLLPDDETPDEIVRRLERRGGAKKAKVTLPEGFTRFDIARRMQNLKVAPARAFLDATTDPALLREFGVDGDSFEGYLFPATYEFAYDSEPRDLVRRLASEFERRYAALQRSHELGLSSLAASVGWGRREVLILASLVEREAAVDDERPLIASVFLNRLRDPSFKRRVLQCDPTAGYGCLALGERIPSCAGFAGKITHAINFDPLNPYSTYVHEGLPPGPIANPGWKSLEAVASPASTKYLYFVLREGRRHTFSETLDEHNAAVKDLRDRTSHAP